MVKRYNKNDIDILVNILNDDGVLSVPTDTLYGLCAKISSKKAYDKLVDIKERDYSKSFPVMCSNLKQIKDIAVVNSKAKKIIEKLMPGPITIVLKKKEDVPSYVTNNKDTIAIRMATSLELKEIIDKINCPLFMTSANISGVTPSNSLDEIEKSFPSLDGILTGDVLYGEASTVVSLVDNIEILREGPITIQDILKVVK